MSLADLLARTIAHDRVPDQVDPHLTAGAWIATSLLATQLAILHLWGNTTTGMPDWPITHWAFTGFGHPNTAMTITGLALAAAAVLAIVTRGHRRATAVGQTGHLTIMAAGTVVAVPIAWILIVVSAIVVGAVFLAGILLWAVLGAITES